MNGVVQAWASSLLQAGDLVILVLVRKGDLLVLDAESVKFLFVLARNDFESPDILSMLGCLRHIDEWGKQSHTQAAARTQTQKANMRASRAHHSAK